MPDKDDILFGQIAIQAGFVSESQLHEALRRQSRDRANGRERRIGEVLVELGYISREQAQSVLRRQQTRTGEHKMVGRYEVLAKLGEGGMGSVYLARDTDSGADVALKVLPPKLAENRDYLLRFHREAKNVLALHHQNIAAGLDVGFEDGYHFFAMEYIDGPTLYDIIKERGDLPEREALGIALQIAGALEHAAKREIIHRDIKPENIMLHEKKVAKLVDLGLARSYHDEGVRLTQSGMAIGTPHYISPEQARGEHEVDTRSDIYSLGATTYHALTGRVPFDGATAAVIMTKHLNEELPWPTDVNPQVTEGASILLSRMMAKEPSDRYQNPTELVDDIRKVLRGESPSRQLLPVGRSLVSSKRIKAAAEKAERIRRERRRQRLEESGIHKSVDGGTTQYAAALAGLRESAARGAVAAHEWFRQQPPGIKALVVTAAAFVFMVLLFLVAGTSGGPPRPDGDRPPEDAGAAAEPTPEELAGKALAEAEEYARQNPADMQGLSRLLDDICERYPGTLAAATALERLMAITRQIQAAQAPAEPVRPEPGTVDPGPETPTPTPPAPPAPPPPPPPPPPPKESVIELVGEGLTGWKAYGDWSRAGDAIWFRYDAAKPLSRSLVSGAAFGDVELTGEFRADAAGTLTFALRETSDAMLWVELAGEGLSGLGPGWKEFTFAAKGGKASFRAGGREFPVRRQGDARRGSVRFSLVGGTLGLRRLRAKSVGERAPDRLLLFGADFEADKSELWARGRRIRNVTHGGSVGALSGEDIRSQNFSSVVILSETKRGLFRAGEEMRLRFAVYLKYASYMEVRVYIKDVRDPFVHRPRPVPPEGTWTVIDLGTADLRHASGGPLRIVPGDEVIVISVVAGRPPERTQLVVDDFEVTVKR